ncbi:MAG TPA: ABC transporter substrate-binding protein [Hyphomicrobiales bacterium]|nr:ABC transporter substrate-binding protein [Hyphomicrobiales bacterium]
MFANRIDRRGLLGAGLALAAGAALPKAAFAADEPKHVTYMTPFGFLISFAEVMYGESGGFFAKEGLDLKIEGGHGSAMSVQQVSAGNVLLSRTGGTDLVKAYAKDPTIVAIAEIFQRDIFYVISAADKPIKSPADMAGKTIGLVSVGGATENLLDMMLVKAGVPKGEVKRETTGDNPGAFEFVKRGRVDGFIASNNTIFGLQNQKAPVVAWPVDEFASFPAQVYMTSRKTLETQTEELAKFLRGVYAAIGDMIAKKGDLAPVIASMSAHYDIPETKRPDKGIATLEHTIETTYKPAYDAKLAMVPGQWDSAYALMVKAGIVPELKTHDFYDDRARKLAFG